MKTGLLVLGMLVLGYLKFTVIKQLKSTDREERERKEKILTMMASTRYHEPYYSL